MIGDSYLLLDVRRVPLGAAPYAHPGKLIVFLYNERNTVTNIIVADEDGSALEWPLSLEDEIEDLMASFKGQILGWPARPSMTSTG